MNDFHFKRLTIALALIIAPVLHAQNQASQESAPETVAAAADIICTPAPGKNPSEQVGPIVMGNMPILQVIDLLRNISGRVIIPGENLPKSKLNFNSGTKLQRTEAIAALENILALNGVSLRLMDNGFVRAIESKNPDNSGAPLIEHIPEGVNSEQIYSKIFKLNYFDSNTAFQRLRSMTSTKSRSAILNQPEINSLIITDSLNNLKRMETIIKLLDQPTESRFELYTFPVDNGSAGALRSSLYQIFRTELNNRLRTSLVHADNRTNKLMVITHPSNYEFFKKIIEELDQPVAPFTTTEVIKIKEGNYWHIWSTIRGIVRHQQSQFQRRGFRNEERSDNEINRVTTTGERSTVENDDNSAEATPPVEVATANSDPNVVMTEDSSPELQFSPYISLYTDPSNKAYVIYGTQQDIKRMRGLIEMLDIKSAPYVTSEVFDIQHARATEIRNVIEYTVVIQRRNFSRAGIQSGNENSNTQQASASESDQQGFEYSNFVATIADNRNNTILVQGTQQDIAQIKALISKLDVESAPLTSNQVIYLKHAEANTLARVIQNIINQQRHLFARQRVRSQSNSPNDNSVPDSPEIGFEFSDYAVVNADRRTNALFIYGTKNDIERVKSIVAESDIPVEPITDTQVFSLTHTDATQTSSLINRVINGQQRALRQVRSESRDVSNPTSVQNSASDSTSTAGIVEGQEALQFSSFISITPDRRSNSIIVYGTATDIRQVQNLIAQIDIEVSPLTTSKIFLLENTQARSLYSVLNSVVRGQERALAQVRSSIREIRNIRPDDSNLTEAELSLESLQFSPYVTITPNDRNNSIIIYGTESDISQLESLIEVSDIKIAPKTQSRTFFIRHADANDISSTLTNLIRQQQRVRERESTLTRVFRRGDQLQDENGEPIQDSSDSISNADLLSETSSSSYNDLFSFDEDLQFSPYVSIVADDRSNAVLAYGTTFDLDQVANLIEQIDNVLPQVKIEVVIAEVILSGDQISGLETFGISYNVTNPNQTTIGMNSSTLGDTSTPGFDANFSLNDFSLDSVFGLAKSDSNVKVLSAPTITTTHNRLASINVGESRPIITSSASNLNSSDLVTRSTIEFRDIGITLKVRPLVSENGFIQMDLEQIVETVIDTQTIDGNVQPIIGTRRASSFVSVRNEEVIVMGGLQAVDATDKDGEVFALGKLPVFGSLFRPRSHSSTVRELIIFIRPRLVESSQAAELITREHLQSSSMSSDLESYFETGKFKEQIDKMEAESTSETQAPITEVIETSNTEQGLIPAKRVDSPPASVTPSRETELAE
ncbi:secretin N-terminal domain-containing protein [Coraliomargarita sp. SDUM461004]|uniref:Secretin N-terminal domain-containing protein n=1 Tax=Thalassobacterium sedimentorum TaxID=3041258 RepID=A0ABU1AIK0_9BACT|nr:secretin N-terminal domain-containing protein [Coraliomargarita sp. SDUM461004]MDQ8193705.1 secretin N-terminal domain-containing protein [Coraliomargarita sp. SDUM461004]